MSHEPPLLSPWVTPTKLADYPAWPHAHSGFLVEGHAAWRSQWPILRQEACVGCLQCYLLCPDAAIRFEGSHLQVHPLLCKGCGVCAQECRHGAIVMEEEKS